MSSLSSTAVKGLLDRLDSASFWASLDPKDREEALALFGDLKICLTSLQDALDHPLGPPARWPFWLEPFHLVKAGIPSSSRLPVKGGGLPRSMSNRSFPRNSYSYGSPSRSPYRDPKTHKSQSLQDLTSWREPPPRPKPTKTEHEAAIGAFRTAFNKLSKGNFDKISQTLLAMKMPTKAAFDAAVKMVFEKALEDSFFQQLYARLACVLGKKPEGWCEVVVDGRPDGTYWWALPLEPCSAKEDEPCSTEPCSDEASGDESKDDESKKESKDFHGPCATEEEALDQGRREVDFRRSLLSLCQTAFKEGQMAFKEGQTGSHEDKKTLDPRSYFSTMTFIGELFVEGMAPLPIVYICLGALLGPLGEEDFVPGEAQVQALCAFMTTVGKVLQPLDGSSKNLLPLCLETLGRWSKDKALSSRLRFGCMDLLDLAKKGWSLAPSKKCLA